VGGGVLVLRRAPINNTLTTSTNSTPSTTAHEQGNYNGKVAANTIDVAAAAPVIVGHSFIHYDYDCQYLVSREFVESTMI